LEPYLNLIEPRKSVEWMVGILHVTVVVLR
jgi:hypothetical protein